MFLWLFFWPLIIRIYCDSSHITITQHIYIMWDSNTFTLKWDSKWRIEWICLSCPKTETNYSVLCKSNMTAVFKDVYWMEQIRKLELEEYRKYMLKYIVYLFPRWLHTVWCCVIWEQPNSNNISNFPYSSM